MKLHTPNLGAPACARSFARLRLASRAQLHAFRAAARTSRRLHARTGAHTRLRAGCFAWLRACSASRGCASCRLHARTCTLSASHGFTRLGALRAARGRLRSLRAGCFAWLGAAWRVLNSRVYINWARFARLPTLRAGFVRAAERARLRAASHASRGFAPFARASRTRFARLHAPRAGFVRAPAHAHLRTRTCARAPARGFAGFAWLRARTSRARLRTLRAGLSRPQGGSFCTGMCPSGPKPLTHAPGHHRWLERASGFTVVGALACLAFKVAFRQTHTQSPTR